MDLPKLEAVKTADEAQSLAIDYQAWASDQDLSLGEVADYADYFRQLGYKFGLTVEFEENGII